MKGLIDIHTHGLGRYDTRTEDPGVILKMAGLHAAAGTAAILLTIYSGSTRQMRAHMEAVREAMNMQRSGFSAGRSKNKRYDDSGIVDHACPPVRQAARILGVHLEGPFLNPLRCGAQDRNSFIKPATSDLKKLIEGYEDMVKVMTIAPELPGALKVIETCLSLGIRVNMGHSDATCKQAHDGKKAGATGISHIFNAMRPFHHREPGLAGFGLIDNDVHIEVIADRIHISDEVLKLIFRIKRHDRIILVSDSVKGIRSKKGCVYARAGVLAGSAIPLAEAERNLVAIGIAGTVSRMAAADNPRAYLGMMGKR